MKNVEELQKHVENWDPEEGDEYIRYHLHPELLTNYFASKCIFRHTKPNRLSSHWLIGNLRKLK